MDDIRRVTPKEALALHSAGSAVGAGALIVATYPEERFRGHAYIAEAVSLDSFAAMLPGLDRAREIIFY